MRNCVICGELFGTSDSKKLCCSGECNREYSKMVVQEERDFNKRYDAGLVKSHCSLSCKF